MRFLWQYLFLDAANDPRLPAEVFAVLWWVKAHRTAASLLKKGLVPAASDAQRAA